jgi:phage repressor protein C with HTH and peptisase S24 domain
MGIFREDGSINCRTAKMDISQIRVFLLRKLFEDSGLDRNTFAEKIGISYVQYGHYAGKNPTKNIGDAIARRIEEKLELPYGFMDSIRDEDFIEGSFREIQTAMTFENSDNDKKAHDLYFTKYSARASMGEGLPAELEHDEIIGQLGVSREWANRYLHKATTFNQVTLITGLGDSMSPTYADGETLFLDESVKDIKLDAVYAFKYDDKLYIKRVQRQKNMLKIMSDNKNYDTWIIEEHELDRVRVIGRIIHGCRIFDV